MPSKLLIASTTVLMVMSSTIYAQDSDATTGEEVIEDGALGGEADGAVEINPDEIADDLNAQQQLKQTVTLTRTINGEVVETEKRTVIYDKDQPYRETEAGKTTTERLLEAFDGEVLTRTEAFDEARIDFTIADADRNGLMTAEEFTTLVESWRQDDVRDTDAPTEEIARQRQYDSFLKEIDPYAANLQTDAYATQKFKFMAGVGNAITREDYIREYLLDFDSMDVNKDTRLEDEELMRFRAVNRGETLDM